MSRPDFWCEITVSAGVQDFPLRGYLASSPRLAVRWLREQASRLADLADPAPSAPWLQCECDAVAGTRAVLQQVSPELPDGPQELRSWRHDWRGQESLMGSLADGGLVRFVSDTGSAVLVFSARPLRTYFADEWRLRELLVPV
ncbi:hypothetical protein ACIQM4_11945 [Streptomyces sp. NPDC091272]|uniref:hypothetical protein n=1 Tax=Streptomyces sp. NPDC091272 TaxID=3365981 RepID=UPI003804FD6E